MAERSANRPNNPRRPPAHRSVSLRHSHSPPLPAEPTTSAKVTLPSRVPSSNAANPPSSLGSTADVRKEDSGESSNAEKWFERSNNDVQANTSDIADLEPPFFLKNSSSSETPPDAVDSAHQAQSSVPRPLLPYRSALVPLDTAGSSSEDFRSVIDDLTVENKKLKRKLKKYEKLYDAHLQQEKLFEIRVHGLPAQKKRELEETLRKFALSLEATPPTEMSSGYAGSTPAALDLQPTTSSHNSTRFADSAYVSNTASGQGSAQQSFTPSVNDRGTRKASKHATATSRNQDIQSYLHDIPSTLLPQQPVAMTEKSKRKLVVRRLEQIFAGKGAALSGHQQPLQQQEVSQSAARDDRMAIEAAGQEAKAEGLREARIMPKGEETIKAAPSADLTKKDVRHDVTGKTSPEQRPTRPLDLDLHRAQVPQENIQYIRHLGFSPADHDAEERIDDHGYIYLNVLTNMAQLHTLNVTTDFVKKSIAEYSDKLMLSRDGRKVRWKGGQAVTKTSSDGSPGERSPNSSRDTGRPKKKRTAFHQESSSGESNASPAKISRAGSSNKLAYVPLFFHKQDSAEDDVTSEEQMTSWDSPQQEHLAGDSSGLTSSGIRTSSSKRKRGDNGPIIFYNKMKFCTDLSGDHNPTGTPSHPGVRYDTIVTNPVGVAVSSPSTTDLQYVGKGALSNPPLQPDNQMEVDSESDDDTKNAEPIRFSPKNASVTAYGPPGRVQPEFEVSGLGGVQPSDHFSIEVQSRRKSNVGQAMPHAAHFARNKVYPQRVREILGDRQVSESSSSPVIEEEVVSTNRHNLPASVLPEPATLFTMSSYGDDSDEDMADDSGVESDISDFEDDVDRAPSAAPQPLHFQSEASDEEEDSSDESSDGSVDLLAGAREVDPRAVHEREREYDADMAERLADEIPAGSSAATAGGGSGFNTPSSPKVVAGGLKSPSSKRRQSVGPIPSTKRAKTGLTEKEATVTGVTKIP